MHSLNKTILDILLETNRLTQTEASGFGMYMKNSEIEEKLKNLKLVSNEDIAKAYSILYDLPMIRLDHLNISPEVFEIIPSDLITKYHLLAFEKEGNIPGGRIKIAIGNPSELNKDTEEVIERLKANKKISAELYITTPEDIDLVVKRFLVKEQAPQVPSPQKPPVPSSPPPEPKPKIESTKQSQQINLKTTKIPYQVITKFPREISEKYKMIVFEAPTPNLIKIAVSDPEDSKVREILDFVKQKNNISIQEYLAPVNDITDAINRYYQKPLDSIPLKPLPNQPASTTERIPLPGNQIQAQQKTQEKKAEEQAQKQQIENNLDKFLGQAVNDVSYLEQVSRAGDVPRILAATVSFAVFRKASDIHIESQEKDVRIRFRVDGVLKDVVKLPILMGPAIISRIKILSNLKIDESRVPQDGRFDVVAQGHEIDLRISILPTVFGEKAAIRILDKAQTIFNLEDMGMTGRGLKIVERNIVKPFGIILATGPTGSGKSTTLYSILQKISTPENNVVTLEDPVEYEIPGINQCQIKPKIGFSFAEGLRSVLRQDPNIIMVGEIRDAETAGMATHAALTGHLVLTTLHTNDAAGALPRLINMGIEPFLITSSINIIIAQRLVRKICQKCKKEIQLPSQLMSDIERELGHFNLPKPYKFYDAQGCNECNQGYLGRVGIYEVLEMTDKIEELAVKRLPASEIAKVAIAEGMVTLKQDGLIKAAQGITTVSEILRVTMS